MQGNIRQVPHWGNEADDEWRDPEERIREDQITRRRIEDQVGIRKNQTSWREETRRQRKTGD